jgi:hypothetical protein
VNADRARPCPKIIGDTAGIVDDVLVELLLAGREDVAAGTDEKQRLPAQLAHGPLGLRVRGSGTWEHEEHCWSGHVRSRNGTNYSRDRRIVLFQSPWNSCRVMGMDSLCWAVGLIPVG